MKDVEQALLDFIDVFDELAIPYAVIRSVRGAGVASRKLYSVIGRITSDFAVGVR